MVEHSFLVLRCKIQIDKDRSTLFKRLLLSFFRNIKILKSEDICYPELKTSNTSRDPARKLPAIMARITIFVMSPVINCGIHFTKHLTVFFFFKNCEWLLVNKESQLLETFSILLDKLISFNNSNAYFFCWVQ